MMGIFNNHLQCHSIKQHLVCVFIASMLFSVCAAAEEAITQSSTSGNSSDSVPEVWLCAGDRILELLEPGAEWPFVKQHLTGIKLYIGQMSSNRRRTAEETIEHLRPLVRLIRAHNLQVAVELGGCLDFSPMDETAGEWSAKHELAALNNFYAAGGKVDFLDLDGPIRRLLHPENRQDNRRFDSIEDAADQLVNALRLHQEAYPEIRYWLLTNFPNWGWRGDVSYHARGPQQQDYGDYDQVVRIVLEKLQEADITLEGVTVDNPYDYLVGEHFSVNLPDPKSVDWIARVREYEEFAREQGLTFNLIINSQRGGHESDERYYNETLQMLDTYIGAGGHPTRLFVQSWYPFPKEMLPETSPYSMTSLLKAVIKKVDSDVSSYASTARPDQDVSNVLEHPERLVSTAAEGRIVLQPVQGKMVAAARVPRLGGQSFALGIPETIGSRDQMILNFPEVDGKLVWAGPSVDGSITSQWTTDGVVHYHLRLIPDIDFVDIEMTVVNLGNTVWRDVFAFNCLNPTDAREFLDWNLERTYMSSHGEPILMAETQRVQGHMPTVGFYTHEQTPWGHESVFVRGFSATSPNRTDDSWIVTLSEDGKSHMAATSLDALFLFDNLDRCCIHSATNFGDIGPGEKSATVARLYLAEGNLDAFLNRFQSDRVSLKPRQAWARPGRPRLELEGVAPPESDQFGVLGFLVRAPWMHGAIEQRFPETIQSSLGMHFIDHHRSDMLPLFMLSPFPEWETDEITGTITYTHKDQSGLVFSGRARPYEDEVAIEYRIRNETGQTLHNINAQMCTNLGLSPDFDPKEDVSRTFTWINGQWTSWAETTPNLTREGRHPWILMQVQGTDYTGPREYADGWWVVDQVADHGIAARVTRSNTHLASVRWDTAPMVISNSKIPCLHAGPVGGVTLDPGEEVIWRGTIYLMENAPEQLLRRYHAAKASLKTPVQHNHVDRRTSADQAERSATRTSETADMPSQNSEDTGPFQIVRSFPVSEATWVQKVGDLYLVAAQRSVLVYRKTGPSVTDYLEVNRIFPGVDGRIENCVIAGQRLFVPASAQGLFAYRLDDLENPEVQPVAHHVTSHSIGAISVAGSRVYAVYRDGGLGVFDARTLELLGEKMFENGFGRSGLTAEPDGIVYTSRVPEYGELLIVDARNPNQIHIADRFRNADYATHYRFPGSFDGTMMYLPEGNGGVGVYDITDPLQPMLQHRILEVGDSPPRGARALPNQVRSFALQDGIGYLARDREVVAIHVASEQIDDSILISQSKLSGGGLLDPQAVFVREGVAAIPTTMEGVRFIDVSILEQPNPLLTIDLPSRFEGLAKVGSMLYATADIDGVWQIDWDASGGPSLSRRIETHSNALPGESLSEDLVLHHNHLYVADGLGLAVIDVTDEDNPHQVYYWDFPYTGGLPDINEGWVEGVGAVGDTLYLTLGNAGLATFDISDPAKPVLSETITLEGTWGKDVAIAPQRHLLAYAGREKFVLLDVRQPQQPVVLSSTQVERGRPTAGAVFSPDGTELVVIQHGMFTVYDVSDPSNPRLLSIIEGHGSESAIFYDEFLLVSGRGAGVGIWRVGQSVADLTRVQTLPCYFYNSKFWVDGERIFTNAEGIDEIRLVYNP